MKALRLLAGASLALVVAACGGTAAPASAPASPASASPPAAQPASSGGPAALSPAVDVKWGVSGLIGEAGIFIAKERGYFQQQGLNVDLQVFKSFPDEIPLLATGQLDFGNGGLNADLFNAVNRDIPLRIVAATSVSRKGDGSAALLVRQDHIDSGRYKSLKDLKGMSIAENSLGTSSQLFTEKILAQGGLTKDDVTFPNVPFPQMATALANKGVDSVFAVEPFVSGMVSKHLAKSVITGAEGFPGGINNVIIISPVFAKQKPEAAKRAMYAFLKGQREYLAAFIDGTNPGDKDAIIQILTKYTANKDPSQYAVMGLSSGDPNGAFDLNVLNEFQNFFVKNGSQQKKIDAAQVVDMSYADAAVQWLGKA
jgi:NitT/TauT family transport system substrate-binding protein